MGGEGPPSHKHAQKHRLLCTHCEDDEGMKGLWGAQKLPPYGWSEKRAYLGRANDDDANSVCCVGAAAYG